MIWILTGVILTALIAVAAVVSIQISKKQERRDRYLSIISRQKGGGKEDSKDKMLAKQKADIARKLKEASEETHEKKKDKTSLRQKMIEAGIEAPVSHFWAWSGGFALLVAVIVLPLGWPAWGKIATICTAFLGVPKVFLNVKTSRRQKKFLEEFADALDAMGRLLQAGMPMSEAIVMVSREFQGPLKEEMTRIYENQKIGTPIGEAAMMTARRIPIPEVQMFATALQIQSETGSSLSEVLSNLSSVIRSRFRLRRKVKALSSEAKSSAAIIGALPILVTTGLYFARPEYIGILFHTPKGVLMLEGAAFWMFLGCLMMRQMINFRI